MTSESSRGVDRHWWALRSAHTYEYLEVHPTRNEARGSLRMFSAPKPKLVKVRLVEVSS